jgi:hypothetical protein
MKFYIVLFHDGSYQIFKNRQAKSQLPNGARQFVCSSNVTVQELTIWVAKGYKGLNTIEEVD